MKNMPMNVLYHSITVKMELIEYTVLCAFYIYTCLMKEVFQLNRMGERKEKITSMAFMFCFGFVSEQGRPAYLNLLIMYTRKFSQFYSYICSFYNMELFTTILITCDRYILILMARRFICNDKRIGILSRH